MERDRVAVRRSDFQRAVDLSPVPGPALGFAPPLPGHIVWDEALPALEPGLRKIVARNEGSERFVAQALELALRLARLERGQAGMDAVKLRQHVVQDAAVVLLLQLLL